MKHFKKSKVSQETLQIDNANDSLNQRLDSLKLIHINDSYNFDLILATLNMKHYYKHFYPNALKRQES